MQIYKTVGQVTLGRCHPSFDGATLIAVESAGEELLGRENPEPDLVVAWDTLGAGLGSIVAISDGPEAAQAFRPALKPIDAFNAAILDQVVITPKKTVDKKPSRKRSK